MSVIIDSGGGGDIVIVLMLGLVILILVEVGQVVISGQILMIIEVMKMEYLLIVLCDGLIKEILMIIGQQVFVQVWFVELELVDG